VNEKFYIAYIALVVILYGIAGSMDYNDQSEIEKLKKGNYEYKYVLIEK